MVFAIRSNGGSATAAFLCGATLCACAPPTERVEADPPSPAPGQLESVQFLAEPAFPTADLPGAPPLLFDPAAAPLGRPAAEAWPAALTPAPVR